MPFNNNRNSRDGKSSRGGKPTFGKKSEGNKTSSSSSSFSKREDRPFKKDDRPFKKDERPYKKDDRPFRKEESTNREHKSYKKPEYKKDDRFKKADHFKKPESSNKGERANKGERPRKDVPFKREDRPFSKEDRPFNREDRPFKREDKPFQREDRPLRKSGDFKKEERPRTDDRIRKPRRDNDSPRESRTENRKPYNPNEPELIRLNRYIANAGVCSRRKADELIEAGVVSVNGEVVTSLGTKVNPATDEVKYNGERLKREKMVYILLNKPKDYITTTDDPQERRTVMHLVEKATNERIYPIGRLDRNTTGLLLLTNDGELADKLSHPRNSITKIYQVELNKNLSQGDFNKIEYGLELEDGVIKPDDVSYVQGASKKEIGIQIHSGKNRIVRRIFEHLGYEVVKLDRVIYANLTKKDLPRGRWRHLEEKEIIQLKHLIK